MKPPLSNIIAMCAAMALFVVNDACVKLAAGFWPPHQIMVIRGGFAVLFLGGISAFAGDLAHWRMMLRPLILLRCFVEGFVALTFITALAVLPIADITAVLLISPLLITVAGALLFGETVRWRRWLAVIVGFIGMLLVVKPGGESFGLAGILALASTVGVAVRDLMTRRLPEDIPSRLVALGTTIATMSVGGMLSLVSGWNGLSATPLSLAALAGIMVAVGNLAIVVAFRNVDVSIVSPFRYTLIVWAIFAGFLVFGERPSLLAWLGILLIVASGLFTLQRERVLNLNHEKNA